jgi:hypothetical protein
MALLPPFTDEGARPAGDYLLTIDELVVSSLVLGWWQRSQWDAQWRRVLVGNLAVLVKYLWQVGVREIFIDGSFVENKPHPNDIDGYFVCDKDAWYGGELTAQLQAIDPVWNWERRTRLPGSAKRQLEMWHKYRVELFPHVGQGTGILDRFGHELEFPSAFRQTRDFAPKGIVKIGGAP